MLTVSEHAADVGLKGDPRHHPGLPRRISLDTALGFVAVLTTTNVVGGFVVTDQTLKMFKGRRPR